MRFTGKVAIITGGGSGIGLATAKLFRREGASVVILEHQEAKARSAVEQLHSLGPGEMLGLQCDVSSETNVVASVEATQQRFGRFDIVVNSAGVMIFKPLEELTIDD